MYRVLKLKEAEESKTVKEYRIIDTSTNKVLKTFKAEDYEKGYNEMREMGKKLKEEGKEDTLIYKEFRVKGLTESEDDEEELEDEEKAEETEEDLEDTVDSEEDQEENPVEEESTLDKQLDEIRDVLVDLDLRLYKIMNNEEEFYIIGRLDPISNQVEMLVDTQPAEKVNVDIEPDGSETAKQTLKDDEETNLPDKDIDIATRFDYIKLPTKFEQIKDMFPRYGEDLTPDHEAIMEYLMNLLIEQNPRAAKERAEEPEDNDEEIPIDDEIVAQEEIPGEEESEDED